MHHFFSLCVGPLQVHNWAKYEGYKLNHVVRRTTKRNDLKWLSFIKYRMYWLANSCAHTRRIFAYYVQGMKFLWSNLWLGELSTENDNDTQWTIHDYIDSSAHEPKCNNKNIGHKWILAPKQMYTCIKYESSKSNHVSRRGRK